MSLYPEEGKNFLKRYDQAGKAKWLILVIAAGILLLGESIDFYVAMNMDGISELNDLAGGVTVTLEDDFSSIDPAMTKGTTLTLHGDQAETFVRSRMTVGDGTNASRMERQEAFRGRDQEDCKGLSLRKYLL